MAASVAQSKEEGDGKDERKERDVTSPPTSFLWPFVLALRSPRDVWGRVTVEHKKLGTFFREYSGHFYSRQVTTNLPGWMGIRNGYPMIDYTYNSSIPILKQLQKKVFICTVACVGGDEKGGSEELASARRNCGSQAGGKRYFLLCSALGIFPPDWCLPLRLSVRITAV